MTSKPQQIIEAAGRSIADPSRWAQGALARNARGAPCCFMRAYSYDITGAILRCGQQTSAKMQRDGINSQDMIRAIGAVYSSACRLYKMTPSTVNDRIGHEAVMKVLRRAWTIAADFKEDQA